MSVIIFFSIQTDVLQSIIDEDVHFKNFMGFQKKKNFLSHIKIFFFYLEAIEICDAAFLPPRRPARWSKTSSIAWLTKAPLIKSPAAPPPPWPATWSWCSSVIYSAGSGSSNLDRDRLRRCWCCYYIKHNTDDFIFTEKKTER